MNAKLLDSNYFLTPALLPNDYICSDQLLLQFTVFMCLKNIQTRFSTIIHSRKTRIEFSNRFNKRERKATDKNFTNRPQLSN